MNATTTPPTILLVDDAASLRALLRAFFVNQGYVVVGEHAKGSGVLDAITQLQPDIVCLDYHLPDINGMELLKSINIAHPSIAVVMITGDKSPELESSAAEAGAAGFIRKPFTQDLVAKEMRQVVYAQGLYKQHTARETNNRNGAGKPLAIKHARARAVVVDDSATMRMLLTAILKHAEIEIVGEASDGKKAVDIIAQLKPDIVCLDVEMPVMNGLETLKQIQADIPQLKVLMVTAHASRDLVIQASKLGARGYILKPFEPEKVIDAINTLLVTE